MKKTPTKPQKPLNIREERFCENMAKAMTKAKAAKDAGYNGGTVTLCVTACRLIKKDSVAQRIAELKAKNSAKFEMKREDLARHLWAAATTPIGEIDETSPLSVEVTTDFIAGGARGKLKRGKASSGNEEVEPTVMRKKVKMQDKLGSARLLCEMMGWKEPEQMVIETGPKTLDAVRERARAMASAMSRVTMDGKEKA